MMKYFICFFLILIALNSFSQEIIKDKKGNYFLIRKDGTYKNLPPPKKGYKYILKQSNTSEKKKKEKKIKTNERSAKKIITKSVTPSSNN